MPRCRYIGALLDDGPRDAVGARIRGRVLPMKAGKAALISAACHEE